VEYSRIDLGTDYRHIALLRALQGLGIAPLFVPVSQLAYSYLPKHKNNKASSLTNLFRNQGGSFGIAFVTTVLARRTQYHQSVLVAMPHRSIPNIAPPWTPSRTTSHRAVTPCPTQPSTPKRNSLVWSFNKHPSSLYGLFLASQLRLPDRRPNRFPHP